MIQLLCVWVCALTWIQLAFTGETGLVAVLRWHRRTSKSVKTSPAAALMWFSSPPLLSFEPCPRAWRRGRTTGLTKSTRVSFAGMRRGSWGWSWRAAQRMDSSRLSASFSRPERSATAANSARMNSCWKSMIPRWPDSPPGTSTLWSNTAKTPSDSSVSNKVRLFPSFHTNFPAFLTFFFFGSGKPLAFWPAFVFWQQCYCLPLLRGSVDKPRK